MFKPGDKAWNPRYGWGIVKVSTMQKDKPIYFGAGPFASDPMYPDGRYRKEDINPDIFHKEQKFDLSEPEPEIGTWGYFWDEVNEYCYFGQFDGKTGNTHIMKGFGIMLRFSPSLPQHIKDMMEGKG